MDFKFDFNLANSSDRLSVTLCVSSTLTHDNGNSHSPRISQCRKHQVLAPTFTSTKSAPDSAFILLHWNVNEMDNVLRYYNDIMKSQYGSYFFI